MTPLEILILARAKVEQGWMQGIGALNADGVPIGAREPGACCWCVFGAIEAVIAPNDPEEAEAESFLREALPPKFDTLISKFNDDTETTRRDVLALFDRAIALATSQPKAES